MAIHQIQVRYDKLEDRILLRLSTTDECEFRFWLTRRFVKRLWGMVVKMLEQDAAVRQYADEDTRRAVMDFQQEGYSGQGDFSRDFESRPYKMPLGEQPVLLAKGTGKLQDDGAYLLRLHPERGQGIDLTLDTKLLHLFSRLLIETVARADWDIKLALHPGFQQTPAAEGPTPRKLN
jgi:hypothetical protein